MCFLCHSPVLYILSRSRFPLQHFWTFTLHRLPPLPSLYKVEKLSR